MAEPARRRDAIVDPERAPLFLELEHRADIIVDDARLAVAALATDEIGTAEFVIAMKQDRRVGRAARPTWKARVVFPVPGGPEKWTA